MSVSAWRGSHGSADKPGRGARHPRRDAARADAAAGLYRLGRGPPADRQRHRRRRRPVRRAIPAKHRSADPARPRRRNHGRDRRRPAAPRVLLLGTRLAVPRCGARRHRPGSVVGARPHDAPAVHTGGTGRRRGRTRDSTGGDHPAGATRRDGWHRTGLTWSDTPGPDVAQHPCRRNRRGS